jgi:hypothetical protein
MKKDKTLLRFRIYDGDREYTDYAVITNKQRLFYTDGQIISKFFCDEDIDDEQFLSDGRAVRIESQIPISNGDMIKLEKLSMAFLHDFDLEKDEDREPDYDAKTAQELAHEQDEIYRTLK